MGIDEEFNQAVWWVLKEIRAENLAASKDVDIDFGLNNEKETDIPKIDNQHRAIKFLTKQEAIAVKRKKYLYGVSAMEAEIRNWKPRGYFLDILPKFDKLYLKYEKKYSAQTLPDKLRITIKDREIWVNEFMIGKPHAVGSNFEFFEYVRSQAPHTKIERGNLSSEFGDASTKERVRSKSFIKILNELGFKGEILKAFFYKRSKDSLFYRGDVVKREDLEKEGIKITLFLKELEIAHMKNSPK